MKAHSYLDKAINHYRLLYNYDSDVSAYKSIIYLRLVQNHYDIFYSELSVRIFAKLLSSSGEDEQYYKIDLGKNNIDFFSKNQIPEKKLSEYNFILIERAENTQNENASDVCKKIQWAIHGTKIVQADITKHQNISLIQKSTNTDLTEELINNLAGTNSCAIIVSYVTQEASEEDITKFIHDTSEFIFINLCKSIIVGEYIYDDNYSSKLSQLINPKEDDFPKEELSELDKIINTRREYIQVFQKLQRFCYSLKKIICPDVLNSDIEPIVVDGDINSKVTEIYSKNIEPLWLRLFSALLDITYIDFVYITNRINLQKLSDAFDVINLADNTLAKRDTNSFKTEIIVPLKVKLSFLMAQMLNQDTSYKEHENLIQPYYFVDEQTSRKLKKIKVEYTQFKYVDFEDGIVNFTEIEGCNDLNSYNSLCNTILYEHRHQSEIILAIHQSADYHSRTILELIERYIQNNKGIYTSPFLYHTIYYTYKYSIEAKKSNNSNDLIFSTRLLKLLLEKLSIYIEKHKNSGTGLNQVRKYFQDSIYEIKDDKPESVSILTADKQINWKLFKEKNLISFVSYQAKPVNILFLNNYLQFYKQQADELEQEISKTRTQENSTKIETIIKEERHHSIQVLGILGSFIAFVSIISTGAINITHPELLLIYLIVGAALISLFVALIRFITPTPKAKLYEWILLLLIIGALYMLAGYIKDLDLPENDLHKEEVYKENRHTIIFNQNTNQSNN